MSQPSSTGYRSPFIDGYIYLYGVGETPRTLHELAMIKLSAELRSQQDWWLIYQDDETRNKWLQEASSRVWNLGPLGNAVKVQLSIHQVQYVLDELIGYTKLRDDITGIQISCFERIWETDKLFLDKERKGLLELVCFLRNQIPPHMGRHVDVLLDPYRHSLIFGRSFTYTPIYPDANSSRDYCLSSSFSALPTDVYISPDGTSVKYLSYVNGIDPIHSDMYNVLKMALCRFIGLFERVLTSLHRSNPLPQRIRGSYYYTVWDEPEIPEDSDDDEAWEQYSRDVRQWILHRPIALPDVPAQGYQGELTRLRHQVSLRDTRIQVIHSIMDIKLEKRRREVGDSSWNVTGMKNENIVACGFYFPTVEGIDTAELEFRMAVSFPAVFRRHDVGATLRTWGLRSGDPCHQGIGSVPIRCGLSIAFPNIYQRRLRGVRLKDGAEKGRLTAFAFFLVDPDMQRIPSTADVPPQQRDWVYRALDHSIDQRLPPEILKKIVDMVDSLLSDEEANKYQCQMHRERNTFIDLNNGKYFSIPFDPSIGD